MKHRVASFAAALASLPRAVWLLSAISLLNDSASDLVYPLLPLYVAGVLAAGPRALGVIEGAAEATSALLKLVSGVWYDRVRRAKPFVVAGYSLAAIARPLMALVALWPAVLLLRVLDRIGKGLRSSPRDALLAQAVAPAQRGLAFGVHRACDNAGAVIGPLLASLLLALHVPIRDILLSAAVPGALCVLLTFAVREPRLPPQPEALAATAVNIAAEPAARNWRWATLPLPFRRLLLVVGLFALGNSSNAFLLLRGSDLGLSPAQVALWWALASGTATLLLAPLSSWSDRVGRLRLIAVGWTLYVALYLALALTTSVLLYWALAIVLGLFMASTEGAERALIADLVPARQLGSAYGWFYLVNGVALFPASALFGTLWQGASARLAFAFGALCAAAALALLRLTLGALWPRRSALTTNARR
jgi:MFS family permease